MVLAVFLFGGGVNQLWVNRLTANQKIETIHPTCPSVTLSCLCFYATNISHISVEPLIGALQHLEISFNSLIQSACGLP